MTAEELLAKIQRGEIPTREELEAFSASPWQKYRVRPLAEEAFEPEVFESISDATEWCRLHALNNDAVFEIYSRAASGGGMSIPGTSWVMIPWSGRSARNSIPSGRSAARI